ncbi:MAG: hypothetical protein FJ104_01640 [Deltaproteobacteria bacterium]|nr:hypothetical protein [Deltaproteobacteria bacterium]
MSTLTSAELLAYPGRTPVDRLSSHLAERCPPPSAAPAPGVARLPVAPLRLVGTARPRALALGDRIDVRAFPGRDRTERVMHWVRANVPLAATWSDESLGELARSIASRREVVG